MLVANNFSKMMAKTATYLQASNAPQIESGTQMR